MPGWLKVLLVVALIIVLFVVGAVVVGVVWWSRNKDALIGRAKEVMTEGKDFGHHSDNQGCVDESVSRYKSDRSFSNAISTSIFMRSCLDASQPTPGFCDAVPRETEFIKTAQWRVEQCRHYDLIGDSYCQNLFQPVQQFCTQARIRYCMSRKKILALAVFICLLIVAGVLLGAATVGWRKAVRAGNEAATIKALQTIASVETLYYNTHGRRFGTFDELAEEQLLDSRFRGELPTVDGYVYLLNVDRSAQPMFSITADPQSSSTGSRHFYFDSRSRQIHVNVNQRAGPTDPVLDK